MARHTCCIDTVSSTAVGLKSMPTSLRGLRKWTGDGGLARPFHIRFEAPMFGIFRLSSDERQGSVCDLASDMAVVRVGMNPPAALQFAAAPRKALVVAGRALAGQSSLLFGWVDRSSMSQLVEEVRPGAYPICELAAPLFGPETGVPTIALHGWLDNANSFARLAPKLQGLRIVALDMAGHGHSEHRPVGSGYALWDYMYDVLQVAELLGWQRFALLGHSLGAIGFPDAGRALPERVSHWHLIDGVIPLTAGSESPAETWAWPCEPSCALPINVSRLYSHLERPLEGAHAASSAVSREAA
ncbi:hypothetical protein FQR65_LT20801 [Abscondita terminalis]|nr:hypothetical protein FQR65_LT20801 [Abscondita terminalis]